MVALAFLVIALAAGASGPATKESARNATADRIAENALAIGIDFDEKNPDGQRPDPGDALALAEAAPGVWLSEQIQVPDDLVPEPPAVLRDWFAVHSQALANILAALEKGPPEWHGAGEEPVSAVSPLPLLAIVRLEKVILALALIEQRGGDSIAVDRALEASWSLGRPAAAGRTLIAQLIAVAIEKMQAGVLRKVKEPPLQWLSRLGGEGQWIRMLDVIASELCERKASLDSASDPWAEIGCKAPRALAETLRKQSLCEASVLSVEAATRLVEKDLSRAASAELREERDVALSIVLPSLLNASRRAARGSVDGELTLRILELRAEKAASRENRWPEKLSLDVSSVCPGAAYAYQRDGATMMIRFDGVVDSAETGPALPLEFRAGPPSAGAKPNPAQPQSAPLTPQAGGGMILQGMTMRLPIENWWWREEFR